MNAAEIDQDSTPSVVSPRCGHQQLTKEDQEIIFWMRGIPADKWQDAQSKPSTACDMICAERKQYRFQSESFGAVNPDCGDHYFSLAELVSHQIGAMLHGAMTNRRPLFIEQFL